MGFSEIILEEPMRGLTLVGLSSKIGEEQDWARTIMAKSWPREAEIAFTGMGAWIFDMPEVRQPMKATAGSTIIYSASLVDFARSIDLQLEDSDCQFNDHDISPPELFVISTPNRPVSEPIYENSWAAAIKEEVNLKCQAKLVRTRVRLTQRLFQVVCPFLACAP
jgi:hypothetical protein